MGQTYSPPTNCRFVSKYDARTIRERLKDSVLLEGVHYIRPWWPENSLHLGKDRARHGDPDGRRAFAILMANGGVCHG